MQHKIPNIFHFCYFGGKPFSIVNYLAIKSTYEVNHPKEIYFYCERAPEGYWWNKAKELVQIVHLSPPGEINHIKISLPHHQSDIIRLEKLIQFGGIYLDLDILCIKPFTDLCDNSFVMGQEVIGKNPIGLCNAVLLSEKNASFAVRWLKGYSAETSLWQGFRSLGYDTYWNEMSVQYPYYLSSLYPQDITILNSSLFFSPTYESVDLENFFIHDTASYPKSYCHHLWASITYENYLSKLSFESITKGTSTFCKLARQFL